MPVLSFEVQAATEQAASKLESMGRTGQEWGDRMKRAGEVAGQGAANSAREWTRLTETLSRTSGANAARASLQSLDRMLSDGRISSEAYSRAAERVQVRNGLVSEASLRAAAQLRVLNDQYAQGRINAVQYADGIERIQRELNEQSTAADRAGRSLQQGPILRFTELYAKIQLAGMALQQLKGLYDFAKEGAQVSRLRDSFESLGKSEADLEKLRRAALGTIADENLMLAVNKAQLLGVSTETDQLAGLLQVAAVRGRAMGLSTTQAYGDIVTGIGRLSPLILDNLGIIIESEKTFTLYAASIGKTKEQLTDTEKRAALLNKVLAEGAKLGPLMEDSATKFERFEAKVKNATDAVKEFFGEIGASAIDAAEQGLEMLGGYQNVLDEHNQTMIGLSGTYEGYRAEMQRAAGATSRLALSQEEVDKRLAAVGDNILMTTDDVTGLKNAYIILSEAQFNEAKASEAAAKAQEEAAQAAEDLAAKEAAAAQAAIDHHAMIGNMVGTLDEWKTIIQGPLGDEIESFTDKEAKLQEKAAGILEELEKLRAENGRQVTVQRKSALSATELALKQDDLRVAQGKLAEAQERYNAAVAEGADSGKLDDLNHDVLKAKVGVEGIEEALGNATGAQTAFVDNSKKIGELEGAYQDVTGEIQNLADEHDEATKRILLNLVEQQLAVGGWTDTERSAFIEVAKQLGLIDEATYQMMVGVKGATQQLATDQDIDAFTQKVLNLDAAVRGLPPVWTVDVKLNIPSFEEKFGTIPGSVGPPATPPASPARPSGPPVPTGSRKPRDEKATGGGFRADDLMLVGEREPELVAFDRGGTVVALNDIMEMIGGRKQPAVYMPITIGKVGDDVALETLAYRVARHLQRRGS